MKNYIIEQFKKAEIEIDNEQADKFVLYYNLLIEWNLKFNLTAITKFEDVVLKHFVDSCVAAKYIPHKSILCDVGSGAGFPAIPLKILRPDLAVTMMDSVNKKITFLQQLILELKLENSTALHIRAEDAGTGKFRESFDIVTARAVASLNSLSEYCIPLVKKGGLFIAYKGQAETEIESSASAISILGGKIKQIDKFSLNNGEIDRTIIVIEKVKNTDKKYPRGKGKERSQPL